jgi:hypothetical protein
VPGEEGKSVMPPTGRKREPIYLPEMMERLGIEPSRGVLPRLSLSYATAFHQCEACQCKRICRAWLDSMAKAVSFAPHFCPNAGILFELQVDQPWPRPPIDADRIPARPGSLLHG